MDNDIYDRFYITKGSFGKVFLTRGKKKMKIYIYKLCYKSTLQNTEICSYMLHQVLREIEIQVY